MSSELGSLDDVLSDDELISALADRRFNDIDGADELAATLAIWCNDLDAEPSPTTIPTADLAEAAARRRSLRRTGRSIAAAAAVAVVCVGGLAVSKIAMSSHDRPSTVDTAASASQQARAQIWQQLGEARTALMQKDWTGAAQLIAAARGELPSVSVADGRAALTSWVNLLAKAVQEHASLSPDSISGDHEVAPQQVYKGGVPLPPGMASQTPTATVSSTLPMLPTTLPTLQPTHDAGGQPGSPAPTSSTTVAPTTRPSRPAPTTGPTTAPSTHPSRSTPPSSSHAPSPTKSPTSTESSPALPVGPNSPSPAPRVLLPLPSELGSTSTSSSAAPTTSTSTTTSTPTNTSPSAN